MNKILQLAARTIFELTRFNPSSTYFPQADDLLIKHKFIQPAFAPVRKINSNQSVNSGSK